MTFFFKFDGKKYWWKTERLFLAETVGIRSLLGCGLVPTVFHIFSRFRNYYLNINFKRITCGYFHFKTRRLLQITFCQKNIIFVNKYTTYLQHFHPFSESKMFLLLHNIINNYTRKN